MASGKFIRFNNVSGNILGPTACYEKLVSVHNTYNIKGVDPGGGGWGDRSPKFLEAEDECLIIPRFFHICLMKFCFFIM